jgi:oxygen-independent coproporphyrinogen-3 oxidase
MRIEKMKPKKKVGIYVHVPFCQAKCHYCDFVSYAGYSSEDKEAYLAALFREGELYRQRYRGTRASGKAVANADANANAVANGGGIAAGNGGNNDGGHGAEQGLSGQTLYLGGGTPTSLTGKQLFLLISRLRELFQLPEDAEITVEANPGTIEREKLACLKEAGCSRLSLGVQSFSEQELRALGRIHTAQEVVESFTLARQMGIANISLDLMYGLPGQSLSSFRESLRQAVELHPEHLSVYQLKIEEGTPFASLVEKGLLREFDQDAAYVMYREAIEYLQAQGYRHYEISNFALPGKEAGHNQIYWRNEEYLGLGAGAAGFLEGVRYKNTSSVEDYIAQLVQGKLPLAEEENIDQALSMAETMFLGLRLRAGVNKEGFRRRYGMSIEEKYGPAIEKLLQQGLLEDKGTHLALSDKGLFVANLVMQEFL